MMAAESVTVMARWQRLLQAVSATVCAGEVLAIIGPNGAGKSTLLRVLAGELSPDRGRLRIDGRETDRRDQVGLARRRAVLPQATHIAFPLTVEQVVGLGRTPHRGRLAPEADRRIVAAAIRWAGVEPLRGRFFDTLSGGERQRVNLARVVAQIWAPDSGARYLLLDEPTAALDIKHQHLILGLVRGLAADGVGVGVVLHDLNQAAVYADRVLALCRGQVRAEGRPADVLRPDVLADLFEVDFRVVAAADAPPLIIAGRALKPSASRPADTGA